MKQGQSLKKDLTVRYSNTSNYNYVIFVIAKYQQTKYERITEYTLNV